MNDDARLAQRLERAEARFAGGYALACGGTTHDVAGGTAIFAGVGSPFGKAVGIGIGQPVTAADMDALELTSEHRRGKKKSATPTSRSRSPRRAPRRSTASWRGEATKRSARPRSACTTAS
jgi:hypothetical protein